MSKFRMPHDLRPMQCIGCGTFARIIKYKAPDGFECAGKHQQISNRALMEAEILKKFNSERIVQFFDELTTCHNGRQRHIILMELGEVDFMNYCQKNVNILQNPMVFRSVAAQLVEGLKYIHENGYIHCDLSYYNILIKGKTIKICDLGLARRIDSNPRGNVGTFGIVAPEAVLGLPFGPKFDVWSLGCILIYMITLKMPFGDMCCKDNSAYIFDIGNQIGFPEHLQQIVGRYTQRSCSFSYKPNPLHWLQRLIGCFNWNLICTCLQTDPQKRSTTLELYHHETFCWPFHDSLIPPAKKRETWGKAAEENARIMLEKQLQDNIL